MPPFKDLSPSQYSIVTVAAPPKTQYRILSVPGDGGCAVHAAAAAATLLGTTMSADELYRRYHAAVDPGLPDTFNEYKQCWTTVPVADASADTWFMKCVPGLDPTPVVVPYAGVPHGVVAAETLLPNYKWRPEVVFVNSGGHYWVAERL